MVLYTQTSCMMMVWTFETILRDKFWTSCLEEFRMWYSGWPDPSYLDCWPFGILTEKAILRIPPKKKKKIAGSANIHFHSGHYWIRRASELMSSLFQYDNLHFRGKKWYFWNQDPVVPLWSSNTLSVTYLCFFCIAHNCSCSSHPPKKVASFFSQPLYFIFCKPPAFSSETAYHCGLTAVRAAGAQIP